MASKAELAKEASKRKREFYAKLLEVVFDATVENTMHTQSKLDLR